MSTSSRILICLSFLAGISLLSGCAAPGSSITQVGISGRIVDAQGHGVAGQQVDVSLPDWYGLDAWDSTLGTPEDYGHRTQHTTLHTDANGRFSYLFPPNTYSVTFWMLPPLGFFPRQPPKPFVVIHTANISPDFFVVGIDHDHFDYRVWDHATGRVRPDISPRVSGSFTFADSESDANGHGRIGGWQMDLTLTDP